MDWRPLSAHGGQLTDVKFDSSGKIIVRSRQECDPILDSNKALANHSDRGYVGDGSFRRVATIPLNIVHKWMQEGVDIFSGECEDAVARKLNDPDYRYLRTAPGHIGVSNGVAR